MRGFCALAAMGVALACGPAPPGAEVVARDSRYRVTLHSVPPAAPDSAGELRLRVDTLGDWHVAAEAVARLDLEAPEPFRFEPASLVVEHPEPFDGDGFDLVTALRAERSGRGVAKGQLKFGICEGPQQVCIMVRREIELPIEASFE